MARNRYNSYRGRKSWGKRILIAIVVVLAIVLALAIVGSVVLRNYIVYTDQGPQLVLPFFRGETTPTPSPTPEPEPSDDGFVVETTSPSPSPSPSPTPAATFYPRRDTPLGLVSVTAEDLLAGTAGDELGANRGVITDMTDADLTDARLPQVNQALPYSAALVKCFDEERLPSDETAREELVRQVSTLAGLGFDEIILDDAAWSAGTIPEDGTLSAQVIWNFYAALREELDGLGYEGRLSAVCSREAFTQQIDPATGQSISAVAAHLDRVYVPGGNWNGYNLYQNLKQSEFRGSTGDIVTVVNAPADVNWAWAVLPE